MALAPRWQAAGLLGAVGGAVGFLFVFPARAAVLLPPCPLHALTGLNCPGCGSGRMLRALARGDLLAAWGSNPLALLAFGPLLLWAGWQAWLGLSHNRFAKPAFTPRANWAIFWIVLLYGIARNLPWAPFCWLAPQGGG